MLFLEPNKRVEDSKLVSSIMDFKLNGCEEYNLTPLQPYGHSYVPFHTRTIKPLTVEQVRTHALDFLENDDYIVFLLFDGERCVASACCERFGMREIHIHTLCARSGHGYGTTILVSMFSVFRGYDITLLSVPGRARHFYRKLGFKNTHVNNDGTKASLHHPNASRGDEVGDLMLSDWYARKLVQKHSVVAAQPLEGFSTQRRVSPRRVSTRKSARGRARTEGARTWIG